MPNQPSGVPQPGAARGNTFPQWGAGGGNAGSAAGWNVKEATNALQKQALIQQGYYNWFVSESAAKTFISSESSAYGSGQAPGLTGLAAIGDFFARLTEASTWIRVGEFVGGGLILYVGLKAVVAPEGANVGARTVKQTATSATRKLAKLTPEGRAISHATKGHHKVRKS